MLAEVSSSAVTATLDSKIRNFGSASASTISANARAFTSNAPRREVR
jgi:hypothetical protein